MSVMFSSPTAARVLKKQDPAFLKKYDLCVAAAPLPRRRAARRAHAPLDGRSARQARDRPLLADRNRLADPLERVPGVEQTPIKFGSPSFPVYGYDLKLLREADGGGSRRRTRKASSRSCRRCRRAA